MKKVLALVLAVMMLSTIAFAAGEIKPGKKIEIPSSLQNFNANAWESEGYTIKVTYASGAALVKSTGWNKDNDAFQIELKQDYTLEEPTKANLVIKKIEIIERYTGLKKVYDLTTTTHADTLAAQAALTGTPATSTKGLAYKVGYPVDKTKIVFSQTDKSIVVDNVDFVDGVIFEATCTGVSSGTLEFNANGVNISGKVNKGEQLYLYNNNTISEALDDVIGEYDIDEVVNFPGRPTFKGTQTLYFFNADKDQFIYEWNGTRLSAVNVTWDNDVAAYYVKSKTLGTYIISNEKIAGATAGNVTNPDTGANDVVGIATALAAVALVSAAAVSLKK